MATAVVETRALGKSFGLLPVLLEVDLSVTAGHAAVIIGGNGAGKSTLLAILAGVSAPSAGSALVFGQDSRRLDPQGRRQIGMLSHRSFLYPNLTARENLEFYATLYGVENPHIAALTWLRRVGLANFGRRKSPDVFARDGAAAGGCACDDRRADAVAAR